MSGPAGGSPRQEFFLVNGERIYLTEAEIQQILGNLEERVAEWMARQREELTEEEYQRLVIRFLELVKLG